MSRGAALLIATYKYGDPRLRRLTAPAHDAEALATVLSDTSIGNFEVTTLINKPYDLVAGAISNFYRDARGDDLTLLYFTGHGLKDDRGRLYFAMSNTSCDTLPFTGISAEHLLESMEDSMSRRQVLILDCCYGGAFPMGRMTKSDTAVHTLERFKGSSGRGRTVLTASDATQYAFDGRQADGDAIQSVFTRHLVAGLRDGSADLDGDGDITVDELYSYVYRHVVQDMPQQRPKKQDNIEGSTVIAQNANWSLPAALRHAATSPYATDRFGAVERLGHLLRTGNTVVRSRVAEAISVLADDDSKRVSAAAAALMPSPAPARRARPSPAPDSMPPEWVGSFTPYSVGDPGAAASSAPSLPTPYEWDHRDTVIDGVRINGPTGEAALELRAASLRGLSHRYNGTVRQDDYAFRCTDDRRHLVVVVSDGVSNGKLSHKAAAVVSRLGAELVALALTRKLPAEIDWPEIVTRLSDEIVRLGRKLVEPAPDGGELSVGEVAHHLAATALFGVIELRPADPEVDAYFYAVGDSSAWALRDGRHWQPMFETKNSGDGAATSVTRALPLSRPPTGRAIMTAVRKGDVVVLMSDGVGDPLEDGSRTVGRFLAEAWREPPAPLQFAAQVDFARKTHDDDRTAVAVWAV
ncbi:hypothetical protein GCM10009827_118920 [Dactylosporangium maewongense]|uniref:Uncharacterized protein n=1 Tax=Dactylosporangium maewongense TaxID=634393 RepID=A0ABP4PB45_9ACTN